MKHDEFVRYAMLDPELVKAFFKRFLGHLEDHVDLDGLKMTSESFIDEKLRKLLTDLVFLAPLKDRSELHISVLMEHKSEGAARHPGMVFQLRAQEMAFWQRFVQQHPGQKLPIVLLVGLYHGRRPYAGPKTLAETMDGPEDLIPDRCKSEDVIMIDLAQLPGESLREDKLSLFLKVLKHIYDSDFIDCFKELTPTLQKLSRDHRKTPFLIALVTYLLSSARLENMTEFKEIALKSFSEVVGGAFMTLADMLRDEGRQEGIQEGSQKIAINLLREGMDLRTIARVTGLDATMLNQLVQKSV